ncbi:hypothetical protein SRABI106_02646 [Rahnella aquatilis]|nr:hypothetical protein SRABI106_02646 [Rahnella aquatilis]
MCIFLINECSDVLVAAAVGINLANDEEGIRPFFFRCFRNGIVDVWLAAVETVNGDGIERFEAVSNIFRQLNHTVDNTVVRIIADFWRIFFIDVCNYAPVPAIVSAVGILNIKIICTQRIGTAGNGVSGVAQRVEPPGNNNAIKRLDGCGFLRANFLRGMCSRQRRNRKQGRCDDRFCQLHKKSFHLAQ